MTAVALTNLARLEQANYVKDAVFKTVLGPAKVSRRELLRSVPRVLKVESDIPIVLHDRCSGRSESCSYCKDACPVNAISPTKDSVVIDDRICLECGACARECPIGAIQSPSVSDDQIIAMISTLAREDSTASKRLLLLTCPQGLERLVGELGEDGSVASGIVPVAIPCVAAVGSTQFLWAASLGVNLVTVCPDASCSRIPGVLPIQSHLESTKRVLDNLGERERVIQHLSLTQKDSILDKLLPPLEQVRLKRETKLSGSRQNATLEALRTLQAEGNGTERLTDEHMLPVFDLAVDCEKCTLCEVCERECPDHAISTLKENGSMNLIYSPTLCGGCTICEKVCPEGAIKVLRNRELTQILEGEKVSKAKDEDAKCARCGTPIGPKRTLAAVEKKLSNDKYPPADPTGASPLREM